jgi:hypothetical protein
LDEALRAVGENAKKVRQGAERLGAAVPRLRDANLRERRYALDLGQRELPVVGRAFGRPAELLACRQREELRLRDAEQRA